MRKVFRLLCTALYITGIMIDVCSLDSVQQTGPLVAWYDESRPDRRTGGGGLGPLRFGHQLKPAALADGRRPL